MTISLGRQGKLRQLLGRAGPVIIQLSEDEFPSEGSTRLEQKRGQMLRFSRCERHRSFGCSSLTDPWIQPINPSNRQPLDYTHPVTLCGPQSLESNTQIPALRGEGRLPLPGRGALMRGALPLSLILCSSALSTLSPSGSWHME